jgi:hypothetical protein
MSDRDRDVEILALRHRRMLERQLGIQKVRSDAGDRALPAALLYRLPRDVLHRVRLLVRPDTVLRWHRDRLSPAATRTYPDRNAHVGVADRALRPRPCAARGPGKPEFGIPTPELRTAGPRSEGRRIHRVGDLETSRDRPSPPARGQQLGPLPALPSSRLPACDFIETVTLTGTRMDVLAVIEHASRRIRILGATAHPTRRLG